MSSHTVWLPLAIFLGSMAQSATGVGFGVVAGGVFFATYSYASAISHVVIFSLLTAVLTSFSTLRDGTYSKPALRLLLAGVIPGFLLGWATKRLVAERWVLIGYALLLLVMGCQLIAKSLNASKRSAMSHIGVATTGSVLAAAAGFLYAAPGPIAAWALGVRKPSAAELRYAITCYLVIIYVALLAMIAWSGSLGQTLEGEHALHWLPLCVVSVWLGNRLNRNLREKTLKLLVACLVLAAGLLVLYRLS
jgi:uncharacterized protein